MKRLFLVYDDQDFAEWIEDELAEYGRFIRSLEGLDFFFPQWNAVGPADVIILPETVIKSQDSFMNLYQTVKSESPETVFLLIHLSEKDVFLEKMITEGNVCVSYDELDTGLLEERLRNNNRTVPFIKPSETVHSNEAASAPEKKSVSPKVETVRPAIDSPVQQPKATEEKEPSKKHVAPPSSEYPDPAPAVKNVPSRAVAPPIIQETPMVRKPETKASDSDENTVKASDNKQDRVTAATPEIKVEAKSSKKRSTPEEQKEKLQRIKERIVIEEKIVTVHVPVHYNSLLISIVSLYPRAGATFVTANFARMLGENKVPVAVLEPVFSNKGSTYFELMYGDKNAPKEWKSWAEQLQTNGYISSDNNWTTDRVVWIPSNVEPTSNWTEEQTMQLLLAAKRFPVTLCDVSSNYSEPESKKILSMSDEIWIVTDGDPIPLGQHYKTIDAIKNDYPGKAMKVIGNKWNNYIKKLEWKEAVLLPTLTQIPDLGPIVLKHLWQGKMAWDDSKLKNILASPFRPMARTVMAKEMYNLMKKQYGIGARLSGLFRQLKNLDDETKARK